MLGIVTLGLAALLAASAAPRSRDLDGCLAIPAASERLGCLERVVAGLASREEALRALGELLELDPSATAHLASVVGAPPAGSAPGTEDRALRAGFLDVRGQALSRLGRFEEAAESLRAAVELDDGTSRLAWFVEGAAAASWQASIEPGNGRLERAASALAKAGKAEEAKALLARAIASGAGDSAREAWGQLGGGAIRGFEGKPATLATRTWYPPLPDLEVRLHDGGSFRLASARGKVLLIDFWASWCAPCLSELPQVQAFGRAERADLLVLTINARESREAADGVVRALDLSLPVGYYDPPVDRAFNVRSLPTIVLVDREGRIRNRWDAYVPDFEAEVATRARALIAEDPEADSRPLAEVSTGGGLIGVRWAREIGGTLAGVAVVREREGEGRIAVTSGDHLVTVHADGKVLGRLNLPTATAGRLRGTPGRGNARFDLLNFRPGREDLVFIDSRRKEVRTRGAGAPVFDAAALHGDDEGPDRFAVATTAGVSLLTGAGNSPPAVVLPDRGACRVAWAGTGAGARLAVASRGGSLRWLDGEGRVVSRVEAASGSCGPLLVVESLPGVGVLPSSALVGAIGHFLGSDRPQAAVATEAGHLVLVDLGTGEIRFRATWPGIVDLAAGDLDGDGRDELVVATPRSLAVLSASNGNGGAGAR